MATTLAPAAPAAGRVTVDGLDAVALSAGPLTAAFVPAAGMAAVSLRHHGEELLGGRDGVDAYMRHGATLGIPFLHPWANRLDRRVYRVAGREARVPRRGVAVDDHGLPIHGVLPRPWSVRRVEATSAGAVLVADLAFAHPAFPFPHRVAQRVVLDRTGLRIETLVRAGAGVPVPVAFGFHPYLCLPGVPRAAWHVDLPARRHLVADERGIPTGETRHAAAESGPLGARTFDDGYDRLGPDAAFGLRGGGRAVTVRFGDGYPVAQVYAPADDDVVCFEPMTAPVNALVSGRDLTVVAPGGAYRAGFEIRIEETP